MLKSFQSPVKTALFVTAVLTLLASAKSQADNQEILRSSTTQNCLFGSYPTGSSDSCTHGSSFATTPRSFAINRESRCQDALRIKFSELRAQAAETCYVSDNQASNPIFFYETERNETTETMIIQDIADMDCPTSGRDLTFPLNFYCPQGVQATNTEVENLRKEFCESATPRLSTVRMDNGTLNADQQLTVLRTLQSNFTHPSLRLTNNIRFNLPTQGCFSDILEANQRGLMAANRYQEARSQLTALQSRSNAIATLLNGPEDDLTQALRNEQSTIESQIAPLENEMSRLSNRITYDLPASCSISIAPQHHLNVSQTCTCSGDECSYGELDVLAESSNGTEGEQIEATP